MKITIGELCDRLNIQANIRCVLPKKFKESGIVLTTSEYKKNFFDIDELTEEKYVLFNISEPSFEKINNYLQYLRDVRNEKLEKIRQGKELLKIHNKEVRRQISPYTKKIKEQVKEIWFSDKKYIIHCGPTNSGKTYNALHVLMSAQSGIYLAPLRLLAVEIYETISQTHPFELLTGEEEILNPDAKHSSRTVEMMNYDMYYDVVVIDECFMLADEQRGKAWLKAMLESNAGEIHLISSVESLELIENILIKTNKKYEIKEYERKVPLKFNHLPYPNIAKPLDKTIFVTFSRLECIRMKMFLEDRGYKSSILYGNLPPDVKKHQMELFVSGINSVAVSTDVIGMGLNMPCEHICFLKNEKYDGTKTRSLTGTEVKQIGGRAGRYGFSEQGNVWGVNNPPFIKAMGESKAEIKHKTYCSINIDILVQLPGSDFMEKLLMYEKMKYIPPVLNKIVFLEKTKPYKELYNEFKYDLNKINDDKIIWAFLTLPVKETTKETLSYLINLYLHKSPGTVSYMLKDVYVNNMTLEAMEHLSNEIDLILAFNHKKEFKGFFSGEDVEKIKTNKYKIIDGINAFLLNRKKLNKKACVSCGKNVGIQWVHKECERCYSSRRNDYDDW